MTGHYQIEYRAFDGWKLLAATDDLQVADEVGLFVLADPQIAGVRVLDSERTEDEDAEVWRLERAL